MDNTYIVILTLLLILIYVIYHFLMRNDKYWQKHGIPSVNSSVPYVRNMWPVLIGRKSFGDLYTDIYTSMPNCSMVGLQMCGTRELMVRDPELIKTVLQTSFSSFNKNKLVLDPKLDPLLSRNPFFTSGEEWKNQRMILTNTMSTAKLKNMALVVREVCSKFLKYLEEKIQVNNGTLETEAQTLFARFTAEVVASVGFGVDGRCFTEDTGTFQNMGEMMFQISGFGAFKQFLTIIFPSLAGVLRSSFVPKKADQYFRSVVKDVLQAKRNGMHGNDFIQQISDLFKTETGEIDESFVASHASSFFIDGYLTSSFTLGSVAYQIAGHPEVQTKLREEVKKVLRDHKGEITYETIHDMKYMDQVIKESMRLLPVASVLQKTCTEKIKLTGSDGLECVLSPGDTVDICPLGLQKDPKYWEDPEVFDPERFSDEQRNDHQKFVYLPFGVGPRVCVGMRMAMLQIKGALTILLNHFSLELSSKTKQPLTFDPMSFLNAPKGGIWLNIKPLQ